MYNLCLGFYHRSLVSLLGSHSRVFMRTIKEQLRCDVGKASYCLFPRIGRSGVAPANTFAAIFEAELEDLEAAAYKYVTLYYLVIYYSTYLYGAYEEWG
jgi:hypothetical protein